MVEVPAAAAAANNAGGPPQPREKSIIDVLHMIGIFILMQNFIGYVVKNVTNSSSSGGNDVDKIIGNTQQKGKPLGVTTTNNMVMRGKPMCLWELGTVFDLDVLFTDSMETPILWENLSSSTDLNSSSSYSGEENTVNTISIAGGQILAEWHEQSLIFGGVATDAESHKRSSPFFAQFGAGTANQTMNRRNVTLTIPMSQSIWNNETGLYAHVRLIRQRISGVKSPTDTLIKRMVLTRYRKRKKNRDVKSLLDSPVDDAVEQTKHDNSVLTQASLNKTHDQLLLYIKPSLTIQMVEIGQIDFQTRTSIPKQISDYMDWYEGDPTRDWYYPIIYQSEFWITSSSLREVNGTLRKSTLDVKFEPVAMWKWQLQSQTEESWRKQEAMTGEEDQGNDVLRNMLLDTNPYLLAITAIVSILHTIFDMLAFKNDITFFKNKKSMEGISLRSMIVNAGFSLIILLYLADNDTSYMILMSNGVGLVIEVWKISKAVTVSFENGKIEWVEASSYKKSKTKEYDEIATSHLLFITMPLVAGYGMYSLFYQKHKGWYSWVLNTLVGFIYMFGFVMMTPQLFINYKLQSVAHLNMRTMTYKSINTFIDDLFAFVIKMPIMHRLACLRDDLIFFIYLFQRYKYRVDYTRVNEFGQCSQPDAEMLAELERERKISNTAVNDKDDDNDKTEPSRNGMIHTRRGAREKRE
jgi:tRNA A-37 threonylcarbamoyl transferase component Bud32